MARLSEQVLLFITKNIYAERTIYFFEPAGFVV